MKATTRARMAAAGLILVIATAGSAAVRLPTASAPGFPAPPPPHFVPLDEPTYPVRITWAGAGQLWGYTVNNVGLLGLYEVTSDWPGYDGTWPDNVTNWNAFCCEWPAGSRQYYSFSTGMWIGGLVPQVVGSDTVYVPIVASGSYDPDFTPVSPLWASNEYIEPAEDGNPLFVQPGEDRGQGQLEWGSADDFSQYLYYPQTDTASINPRRRAHFGTSDYDVKPTDIVSQMDTYCAMGDYVPEDDGNFLYPSLGYNTEPMGVRVEQRTYSWGYGPAANYIYVNCKITNMNTFAIDSLYVGYFMDNDVGPGDLNVQGVGPNDDLIGFDRGLNLGYTYDSNFNEPGWSTSAGYIGVVFCESPLGLTAFSTWTRDGPEGDVDYPDRDDLKYAQLRGTDIPGDPDPRIFETFDEPQDVRHLNSSGPILSFGPGETISVTLAVVMGASLDELRSNAERAVQQFEMGYLGTAPPPPPVLVATPQDRRVYLSWDSTPESTVDLITGEADFEGYRVYRSPTGVEGTWELLADYDVMGSQTAKAVTVSYQVGGSKVEFGFDEFWGTDQDTLAFVGNDYSLEFYTDSTFTVFNTDQQSLYQYSPDARDVFTGDFCVVDPEDDEMVYDQPDPGNPFLGGWVDGARIYIDGFYIHISSGTPDPQDPPDMAYEPRGGDVFVVRTYNWAEVGNQTGLYYSYLDDEVINGLSYYYAVTSYDRGSPANGIEPLESSISQVRVRVVPRSRAADKQDPDASVAGFAGLGTGEIYVEPAQPGELTGHTYRVECLAQGAEEPAWTWLLRDMTTNAVVSDSMAIVRWDFDDTSQVRTIQYPEDLADLPAWDGVLIGLKAPKAVRVEEVEWTETNAVSWVPEATNWNQHAEKLEPYDYAMTFPPDGGTDVEGNPVPWRMLNLTLGVDAKTYLRHGAGGDPNAWDSRDWVFILPQDAESFDIGEVVIQFKMNMEDTTTPAGPSDTLYIRTIRPLYPGDYYEIRTADYLAIRGSYDLTDVNVVPNPYYVRAMWDTNEYNRWVNFTHLPSRCTIRIFTVSGLLIRTLEHATDTDEGTERWDLRTQTNAHCTSGLYVYQVEDERTGKTKVGKFAIVR
jgi:hypothetical protein